MVSTQPGSRRGVAIYARASTSKQLASLETQVCRLREAAPTSEEFVDRAVSGRASDRPAFQRLSDGIREGAIAEVVATKLDRLGRTARGILEFFELCRQQDVRVRLIDQAVDTSGAAGKLVLTVLAAAAELEAELATERTSEAMAAFRDGTRRTKSGRPVGRPRRITPEIARAIAEARETLDEHGDPTLWRKVAVRLKIPESTCRKVYSTLRAEKASAINGAGRFGAPSAAPEDLGPPASGP